MAALRRLALMIGLTLSLSTAAVAPAASAAPATPIAAATPATADAGPFAVGPGLADLPAGDPDTVAVLVLNQTSPRLAGAILRNNTGQDVARIELAAEVRDAAGNLVAVGQGYAYPPFLPSGAVGLADIQFTGDLPAGVAITATVSFSTDPAMLRYLAVDPVPPVEVVASADGVIGTVRNDAERPIEGGVYMMLACLDPSGALTDIIRARAVLDTIAPGQTSPFSFSGMSAPAANCDRYIITGYGRQARS